VEFALPYLHPAYDGELQLPHARACRVGEQEDGQAEEGGGAEEVVHEVDDQRKGDEREGPLGKGRGG
jgi:hypothetical protein